jgi:L-2-hydroxyglutarate oxidase LhgO
VAGRTADLVVIGGGIVGMAVANAWLAAEPRSRVLVVEKESALGAHASGRNSGVLHAGFYYAPDSLKAQLTRRGNLALRAFCAEEAVTVRETGKVVVTRNAQELPALHELYRRAQANGVPVELVDAQTLAELEPLARTCEQALWSPSTAVADPDAVLTALARRVVSRGGEIVLGSPVTTASPGSVRIGDATVQAGHILNAAGLYADRVAHWFDVGREYRMLPFKGLYWYGNWAPGRLRRHVYPIPDPRNPFLGVHLTVTVSGGVKIGPTAIPALWREDYGGLQNASVHEGWEIARTFPKLLTSAHHDTPALLRSELPKYRRSVMIARAAELVPTVRVADFTHRGRPGVRAQLLHLPTKRLEMDFVVRSGPGSTHILNAVSPAWTSSLAVADYVVDGIRAWRTPW